MWKLNSEKCNQKNKLNTRKIEITLLFNLDEKQIFLKKIFKREPWRLFWV